MDENWEDASVKIAVIHLEGRVLASDQIYVNNMRNRWEPLEWPEYVDAIFSQFNQKPYEDPMVETRTLS